MGGLSSITKAIKGGSSGLGSLLNNITGATSAGKASQKYALQSMAVQNAYEKEAAQNAHQWEVKDLEAAHLNPILSAGGQGAQADTGLSAGSQGQSGMSPMDILNSLTSAGKTIKEINLLKNQADNIIADTANKTAENPYISQKAKAEIANLGSQTTLNSAKKKLTEQEERTSRAKRLEHHASAKYLNERSRGFSESETTSYENGGSFMGSGAHGGATHSKSKTW